LSIGLGLIDVTPNPSVAWVTVRSGASARTSTSATTISPPLSTADWLSVEFDSGVDGEGIGGGGGGSR